MHDTILSLPMLRRIPRGCKLQDMLVISGVWRAKRRLQRICSRNRHVSKDALRSVWRSQSVDIDGEVDGVSIIVDRPDVKDIVHSGHRNVEHMFIAPRRRAISGWRDRSRCPMQQTD